VTAPPGDRRGAAPSGTAVPPPLAPAAPRAGAPARRAARREQIVAAAARTFAAQGYAAVGMREIADAVGIRGASLYHHFGSKEDILFAVCLTVTQEPNERNLPLLDAPGTPATRLAALVRGHLEHLHARRVEYLVGLHELAALTPEHRAVVDDHRRYYLRRVRDVVAAGVRAGEFAVPDPRLAAFAVCDLLNGIATWFHDDGDLALEDVIRGYTALVAGLLGAAPQPARS
jgi:AcrR family transcriptional regulator